MCFLFFSLCCYFVVKDVVRAEVTLTAEGVAQSMLSSAGPTHGRWVGASATSAAVVSDVKKRGIKLKVG